MLYNCIVQSGTVREKLPLVQSLSVVGGWGGMPKLYISQVAPCSLGLFQIFPELTIHKFRFHQKIILLETFAKTIVLEKNQHFFKKTQNCLKESEKENERN